MSVLFITLEMGLAAAGGVVLIGASAYGGFRLGANSKESPRDVFDPIEGLGDDDEGFVMDTYGSSGRPGLIGTWLRERDKRRALDKGYVRWHLVGSSFSKPMYVRPKRKGGGNLPELDHEGNTYYFPQNATAPSAEEGVPVAVHREGESDPLELRDEWDMAVDSKTLSEYLSLRVTSEKPSSGGLLSLGDWDAMTLLRYGLLAIIAIFIGVQVMQGGLY